MSKIAEPPLLINQDTDLISLLSKPTPTPQPIDRTFLIAERRHSLSAQPWNLNAAGNTWKNASPEDRRALCNSLAQNDPSGKSLMFYENALDAFYFNVGTDNTRIMDALDQIDEN